MILWLEGPKWNLHKITICSPNSIPIPVYCQEFYKVLYLTIWGTKEDKINQKMSHFLFKLKSVSRPLETIWGHLRPLEVIWDYVRLFEAMWGHWGYLRPCYLRPCEVISGLWGHLGTKEDKVNQKKSHFLNSISNHFLMCLRLKMAFFKGPSSGLVGKCNSLMAIW